MAKENSILIPVHHSSQLNNKQAPPSPSLTPINTPSGILLPQPNLLTTRQFLCVRWILQDHLAPNIFIYAQSIISLSIHTTLHIPSHTHSHSYHENHCWVSVFVDCCHLVVASGLSCLLSQVYFRDL